MSTDLLVMLIFKKLVASTGHSFQTGCSKIAAGDPDPSRVLRCRGISVSFETLMLAIAH